MYSIVFPYSCVMLVLSDSSMIRQVGGGREALAIILTWSPSLMFDHMARAIEF